MRIEWNKLWMKTAVLISKRSTDPKRKVGCLIVSENNERVLSIGYNGDHKGGTNERLSLETGKSGFIHAEENALIKMDYNDKRDKKLYINLSPCYSCAQKLINGNIKKVYYKEVYTEEGLELLNKHGIETEKI